MVIKINMTNYKGEIVEEEFLLKDTGIKPFQYHRDLSALATKHGNNNFELTFAMAVKYFQKVIGEDRFKVEGLDDKLKFSEVLEEFFMNDPIALDELAGELGFFLSPALKNRLK